MKGMVITAVVAILISMALRIFVFASFKIPSLSMVPTLLAGDFIVVNKLIPGPRMDFLNTDEKGAAVRLKGYRAIKRNDILVFNDPYYSSKHIVQNWNVYYVKRCVGVPGDVLSIKKGTYYIEPDSTNLSIRADQHANGVVTDEVVHHQPRMFKPLGWTVSNFGPVYIPRKGDSIRLDSVNIHVYKKLIEYETNETLTATERVFYIGNQACHTYRFTRNYYFMAGDHTANSKDSRYWGLLPEEHIVGKVSYIWKSINPYTGQYRFDRFFKPVDP